MPVCFYFYYSRRWVKEDLSAIYVKECSMFSSKSLITSGLTLRSLIQYEFIFVYSVLISFLKIPFSFNMLCFFFWKFLLQSLLGLCFMSINGFIPSWIKFLMNASIIFEKKLKYYSISNYEWYGVLICLLSRLEHKKIAVKIM